MAKTSTFTRFIYVYLLFLLAGFGAIVRIILVQVNKDRVTLDAMTDARWRYPFRSTTCTGTPKPCLTAS